MSKIKIFKHSQNIQKIPTVILKTNSKLESTVAIVVYKYVIKYHIVSM